MDKGKVNLKKEMNLFLEEKVKKGRLPLTPS